MTEEVKGPLPEPDAKWHQQSAEYISQLITRCTQNSPGMSLRKIAAQLGINERALRYYADPTSGQTAPYTVQYALEALANRFERGDTMNAVHEARASYGSRRLPAERTEWWGIRDRKITDADIGKIIVGFDAHGSSITGALERDGFGYIIRELTTNTIDGRTVPVDRVQHYTLLDPMPTERSALDNFMNPSWLASLGAGPNELQHLMWVCNFLAEGAVLPIGEWTKVEKVKDRTLYRAKLLRDATGAIQMCDQTATTIDGFGLDGKPIISMDQRRGRMS